MKRWMGKTRQTLQHYWQTLMSSKRLRMPTGAQFINKMISWARGENWRGNRKNKK